MKHLITISLLIASTIGLWAQALDNRHEILPTLPRITEQTSSFPQKLDREESLTWDDQTQSFLKNREYTFWYNQNGWEIKNQQMFFKKTHNPISSGRQYVYEYNPDGTAHTQTYMIYDTLTNDWNNYKKWDIYYTSSQNLDSFYYYNWNTTTANWEVTHRHYHHYTANDKIVLQDGFVWNSTTNNWDNYSQEITQYDANGRDTLIQILFWNVDSNKFLISEMEHFEYDAQGNNIKETRTWNHNNGYFNGQKLERIFDSQNNIVTQNVFIWNGPNIKWTWYHIADYSYDSFNDLVLVENQHLDAGAWSLSSKKSLNYDQNVPVTDLILPYAPRSTNKQLGLVGEKWESNTWKNDHKSILHYSDFDPVSVISPNPNYTGVYPNPFNNYISFKSLMPNENYYLEVFDGSGKRVFAQDVVNEENIGTAHLDAGFYFYTLTYKSDIITGKLIKN